MIFVTRYLEIQRKTSAEVFNGPRPKLWDTSLVMMMRGRCVKLTEAVRIAMNYVIRALKPRIVCPVINRVIIQKNNLSARSMLGL